LTPKNDPQKRSKNREKKHEKLTKIKTFYQNNKNLIKINAKNRPQKYPKKDPFLTSKNDPKMIKKS
jgi:hypothetical protein